MRYVRSTCHCRLTTGWSAAHDRVQPRLADFPPLQIWLAAGPASERRCRRSASARPLSNDPNLIDKLHDVVGTLCRSPRVPSCSRSPMKNRIRLLNSTQSSLWSEEATRRRHDREP